MKSVYPDTRPLSRRAGSSRTASRKAERAFGRQEDARKSPDRRPLALCFVVQLRVRHWLRSRAKTASAASGHLAKAMLMGIDLGPNLSMTGSLATIFWLITLRRE